MRQLFPAAVDPVDPADVYADRPTADGRPAVRVNMLSSVDGATTLDGVSGGLGGLGDKRVFAVLRSHPRSTLNCCETPSSTSCA